MDWMPMHFGGNPSRGIRNTPLRGIVTTVEATQSTLVFLGMDAPSFCDPWFRIVGENMRKLSLDLKYDFPQLSSTARTAINDVHCRRAKRV